MNPFDYQQQQQQQRLMAAAYMNSMGAAPMGSYNPMANMNGMGMAPAPMPGMNMSMNNMTGMLTPGQIYHQAAAPAPVMSAPAAVMMQQPQQQQQQLQPQQPQQLTRPVVRAQPPAKPKVHSARPPSPKHDLTARPDDDGKKSGPWSWKEHQLFERAVIVHGWGNWVQVRLRRLQTLFLTSSANNFYVHTIPM